MTGYVYMNGDIGKLPSGAVYSATPDSLPTAASAVTDYSSVGGVSVYRAKGPVFDSWHGREMHHWLNVGVLFPTDELTGGDWMF
uniref:Uncharacterized protein n=1 Tax=Timema tahoe TaxID=61484 RepID=A0A7R9IAE1_9NEOP|nr:unnamed protein product [Timema tahoe]